MPFTPTATWKCFVLGSLVLAGIAALNAWNIFSLVESVNQLLPVEAASEVPPGDREQRQRAIQALHDQAWWIAAVFLVSASAIVGFLLAANWLVRREFVLRQLTDKRLREREARLKTILDSEPECVKLVAEDGRVLEMNAAGLQMIEAGSASQVIGRQVEELLAPKYRREFQLLNERVFRGESTTLEYELIGLKGGRRWMETHAAPLRDEQGRVIAQLGITRDITARKRAEEALRESEARYRLLAENSDDFVQLLDTDGNRLYVSPSYFRVTGWTMDDLQHSDWRDRMHPDDVPPLEAAREAALAGQTSLVEHRIRCRDGSWIWVELRFKPLLDPEGRVDRILQCSRDITLRKQVKQELIASRASLEEAQSIACMGSWEFDPERRVGKWSKEMFRLFDRDPDLGTPTFEEYLQALHPDDRHLLWEANTEAAETGLPVEISYRTDPACGPVRYLNGHIQATRGPDGQLSQLAGTLRDVTERKLADEALRHHQVRLRLMLEQLPAILWSVDRELRITSSTGAALNGLGLQAGQVVGQTLYEYLGTDDPSFQPIARHRQAIEGQANEYEMEWQGRTFQAALEPLRSEQGEIVGCVGVALDITERVKSQAALQATETMLELVLDSIPQGVFWKDRHSVYLGANRVVRRAMGLEDSQPVVGMTDFDVPTFRPGQAEFFVAKDREVMDSNQPQYAIEESMTLPNGSTIWLETNKMPMHDADGNVTGILGTWEDVTERKRASEALRSSHERLSVLSRQLLAAQESERRQVARELHDEIGQVLTAVSLNLHHLKSVCGPEAHSELDTGLGLIGHAMTQVRDLSLNLRPPMLDVLGLDATVRSRVEQHRQQTGCEVQLEINLESRLSPELEITCYRVIQSALTNIARHAQASQISVEIRENDLGLELVVCDNGIGLDLDRIRERSGQGEWRCVISNAI